MSMFTVSKFSNRRNKKMDHSLKSIFSAKEMDTSSDPEEVNVDMNSPKQEPVDAEAFQM